MPRPRRHPGRRPAQRRLAKLRRAGARARACRSPIPQPHWTVAGAHAAGIESSATSSCSAASGAARARAPFVAITGTNGKSTTTALIAHHAARGRPRRRSSAAISAAPILTLDAAASRALSTCWSARPSSSISRRR